MRVRRSSPTRANFSAEGSPCDTGGRSPLLEGVRALKGSAIAIGKAGVGQTAGRIILPSTHAANAFAFAAAVGTICPGLSVVLVPLAAAIGVARVGIANHYPADVVAGALTGAGIGTAIGLFVRRRYPRSSPLESPTSPLPRTGLSVADPRGRDPRPPVAYDERTDKDRTRLDAG